MTARLFLKPVFWTLSQGVFPSLFTDCSYHASPIQQDYIRPAGKKLGLERVGWHTFRHTYRSWLDGIGALIVQYGNALMQSKREANTKAVQMALRPVPQLAKGK